MADELNKKKPDLNTDNSTMSSKTASEQLKPSRTQGGQFSTNVNKSPKFENNNKNTYSANSVGNKQQPKSNPKQFDATRQKIVNQGFAPKFDATQKFKWSEGLSDEDNTKINTALHNLATYAGDSDLSRVNNEWVDDLAYQLSYEGYDDDEIHRLIDHFDKTAPTYEEAFPEHKRNNGDDPNQDSLDYQIESTEVQLADLERRVPYGLTMKEQQMQKELEEQLEQLKNQRQTNEHDERDQASKLFGTDLSKNPESEEDWSNKDFLKDVKSPTFLIKNKGEYPYQQNSRRAADHLYNQIIDGEKTLKRLEQMGDQFEPKVSEARRNQYLNTLRRQLAKQKNHFAKLYGKYYK